MTPRNPLTGRWTYVAPEGAADGGAPSFPQPGPAQADVADPLPLLTFLPAPSPCQAGGDLSAVSGAPGTAGPRPTNPTQQMQDFGQVMGRTIVPNTADGDTTDSGSLGR